MPPKSVQSVSPKIVQNVPKGVCVTESNGILYVAVKVDGKRIEKLFKTVSGAEKYIARVTAERPA